VTKKSSPKKSSPKKVAAVLPIIFAPIAAYAATRTAAKGRRAVGEKFVQLEDGFVPPQRLHARVMADGIVELSVERNDVVRMGNIITNESTLRDLLRWLEKPARSQ
jgi:hypothetical protein